MFFDRSQKHVMYPKIEIDLNEQLTWKYLTEYLTCKIARTKVQTLLASKD